MRTPPGNPCSRIYMALSLYLYLHPLLRYRADQYIEAVLIKPIFAVIDGRCRVVYRLCMSLVDRIPYVCTYALVHSASTLLVGYNSMHLDAVYIPSHGHGLATNCAWCVDNRFVVQKKLYIDLCERLASSLSVVRTLRVSQSMANVRWQTTIGRLHLTQRYTAVARYRQAPHFHGRGDR